MLDYPFAGDAYRGNRNEFYLSWRGVRLRQLAPLRRHPAASRSSPQSINSSGVRLPGSPELADPPDSLEVGSIRTRHDGLGFKPARRWRAISISSNVTELIALRSRDIPGVAATLAENVAARN